MGREKKITKGKQNIEMKMLECEDARHVCFSKRKTGIFSKASELATLCGAEVAVIVDSPAGCPYSLGSSAVNSVVDRFLSFGFGHHSVGPDEAQRLSTVRVLNNRCMAMSDQFDTAKKKKAMLEDRLKVLVETNEQVQKAENIDELNLAELKAMEQSLNGLKEIIHLKLRKNLIEGSSSSSSVNPPDTLLNLFEPGASQAGSSANLLTISGPSGSQDKICKNLVGGSSSSNLDMNPFSMMNINWPATSQAGLSANPFSMGSLLELATNHKVNLSSMADMLGLGEIQLGQNSNPIMMVNTANMIYQPAPNENTVVDPAELELKLPPCRVNPGAGVTPELEENHHEPSH